jgi:hypothetical protein
LGALSTAIGGIGQQMDQNSQRTMIRNPYAMYGAV